MALDKLSGLLRIGSSYNNGASVKSITGSASSWSQDGKTYYHWTGNGTIELDLLRGFPGKNDRNATGRKIGDTMGNQAIDYLLCGGGGGGGEEHGRRGSQSWRASLFVVLETVPPGHGTGVEAPSGQ